MISRELREELDFIDGAESGAEIAAIIERLIAAEREACIQACRIVREFVAKDPRIEYHAGGINAAYMCEEAIRARKEG